MKQTEFLNGWFNFQISIKHIHALIETAQPLRMGCFGHLEFEAHLSFQSINNYNKKLQDSTKGVDLGPIY